MKQAHILLVDDEPVNLLVLEDLLGTSYTVHTAKGGEQALALLAGGQTINLILLDIMMPDMDGFEVCRHLKADPDTCDIPILFLSTLRSSEDEARGLSLGAEDFIRKPFSAPVVLARVRNHLQLAAARHALKWRNTELEAQITERTREIVRQSEKIIAAQDATISAFCALAEVRDHETGNHIRRTQHYVKALAERLRDHPRFCTELDDQTIELLFRSAPLHDVGKVAIPDAILHKPGKHTPEEWAIMQRHAEYGRDAILLAESELGESEENFLRYAHEIAYSHHEKWDGSGYPQGLAGEAIPLSARLMAAADVYDALISERVYKPAFTHEKAIDIITEGRARHFDPDITDALVAINRQFQTIALCFNDETKQES